MSEIKIVKERKYIDLDTSYENVLEWGEEGHTLVFLSKPELFLDLSSDQVKSLPERVKTSYNLAKADYKTQSKAFTDPELEFLSPSVEFGSSTDQLNVRKDAKYGKELKWVRPENIQEYARKGWNITKADLDSQRGLRVGDYHMVGKKELILMEIDNKKFKALEKEKQERSALLFTQNEEDMKRVAHSMNATGTFETSTEEINIPLT
jgi:hypothetical protein